MVNSNGRSFVESDKASGEGKAYKELMPIGRRRLPWEIYPSSAFRHPSTGSVTPGL